MKYNLLVSSYHLNQVLDKYTNLLTSYGIHTSSIVRNPFVNENELLKKIERFNAIICSDDQITKKVIDKAKKLKVISKWGTGIDSIDIKYAQKKGIKVYNSPDVFSESVASLAWGMALNLSRKIHLTDNLVRKGQWPKIQGVNIFGKTLGIIGLGNIGKQIIKSGIGFGMKILGNDIVKIDDDFINFNNVNLTDKKTLFKYSDVIILCVNLNKNNHNLINHNQFSLMKNKPIIINISRGSVINEEALIKALKNKLISGAGLDVFTKEPFSIKNKLLNFDNCILSSHNAYNTKEAVEYVHKNTIQNMLRGLLDNEKITINEI